MNWKKLNSLKSIESPSIYTQAFRVFSYDVAGNGTYQVEDEAEEGT